MRRLSIVAAIALALSLIVFIGWKSGSAIGIAYSKRSKHENSQGRADGILRNSKTVAKGLSFPDLELWDSAGGGATVLSDLLPEGGTVLYLSPTCEPCFHAALAFNSWLKSSSGISSASLIITNDLASTPVFASVLSDSSVNCRIYCDVTQALTREHGIYDVPAFFFVSGSELKLISAGMWDESVGFIASRKMGDGTSNPTE